MRLLTSQVFLPVDGLMFLGSHSAKEIIVKWSKYLLFLIQIPLKNHPKVCRRGRVWKFLLVMATILEEQFQNWIRQLLRKQPICLHCSINLKLVPGWSFSETVSTPASSKEDWYLSRLLFLAGTGTPPGYFSSLVSDALSSDWHENHNPTVEPRASLLSASSVVKLGVQGLGWHKRSRILWNRLELGNSLFNSLNQHYPGEYFTIIEMLYIYAVW